jgi:RNase P/RNase MRP subunit p29
MQALVGLVMQEWVGLHTRVLAVLHMTESVGLATKALVDLVMRVLVVPTTAVLAVQDTTV